MRECKPQIVSKRKEVEKPSLNLSFFFTLYRITFLRGFLKWLVRKITGKCELQRIVRHYDNAERTFKVEKSLLLSRNQVLRDSVNGNSKDVSSWVEKIMEIKMVIPEMDPVFQDRFTRCLTQIQSYRYHFDEVEDLRKQSYNSENPQHEELLLKLWSLLKPDVILEARTSKDWCTLGFQGTDPKTDFRGMGILGLQCMVHFAEQYPERARRILQRSLHPVQGYSYAIVSINITCLVYELLQSGRLRSHFYNVIQGRPAVDDFLEVFSCIFYKFDEFWFESKPENVMAFNRIRENFALQVSIHLGHPYYGCYRMEDDISS